jgi:molecular chaperone DnaK (HSP70)
VLRVGIDFGTTHTVAAVVDRGNYLVAAFDGVDTSPSLISANDAGELRLGRDAAEVRRQLDWSVLRLFKWLLGDAGPRTTVDLAGRIHRLADLFLGFLVQLKTDLQDRSNAGLAPSGRVGAAIKSAGQRVERPTFLDSGGLRTRCFDVTALLNEPSAAGLEHAHR